MLHWFGKKLREMQEVKRDERGFTLIELLVVVIIIGILAAIAIPTFLNQRDRAYTAVVRSDLRSAVTFNEAYYTRTGGYAAVGAAGVTALRSEGLRTSANVTLTTETPNAGAGAFCLKAVNSQGGDPATLYASDTNRAPSATACT